MSTVENTVKATRRVTARRAGRAVAWAFVLMGTAGSFEAGCGATSASRAALADSCTINSDCASPLVCSFGRCHVACKETEDCDPGERCVKSGATGVCQEQATCSYNSDCPPTLICGVDQHCRAECRGAPDCLANQVCVSGSCADQNELDANGHLKDGNADAGSNRGAGGTSGVGGSGTDHGGTTTTGPSGGNPGRGGVSAAPDAGIGVGPGGGPGLGGNSGVGGNGKGSFCGEPNQPCCQGTTCSAGAACSNNFCVACGATNALCCAGDTCSASNATCSNGNCVECGALTEPCCGSACNGALTCISGTCSVSCTAPLVASGAACVLPAPRPIGPFSGSFVNTRAPKLSWILPSGISTAHVDVCSDRACTHVVYAADVAGTSANVGKTLSPGTAYWRLRSVGTADAGSADTSYGPVWQFQVGGAHDAPKTAAWGTSPDFNGDGFADLVVETASGTTSAELYAGSALGPSASSVTVGSGFPGLPIAFDVGDVNGDGFADLFLPGSGTGGGGYELFFGSATGLPAAPSQSLSIPVTGMSTESIGDVDGDGYADLIVPGNTTDGDGNSFLVMNVYAGGPSGLSIIAKSFTTAVPHQGFGNSDTGDVNADGYADVVVASGSSGSSTVSVFYGGANGLNPTSTDIAFGNKSNPVVACVGDVNGDGYVDMMALSNSATVYFGGPGGIGVSPTTLTSGSLSLSPGAAPKLGTGDMNGDGFADFVVPGVTQPALLLYLGETSGVNPTAVNLTPTAPSAFTVNSASVQALAALGDVDGDGYTDFGAAVDWVNPQQIQKHQIDVFSGKTPANPAVLSVNVESIR